MNTRDEIIRRKKELEGRVEVIDREITQWTANKFAMIGAIEQFDLLLKDMDAEDVPETTKDETDTVTQD